MLFVEWTWKIRGWNRTFQLEQSVASTNQETVLLPSFQKLMIINFCVKFSFELFESDDVETSFWR